MSQAGILQDQTTALGDIETLTGNSGGAVGPDGAGNVDFVGDNTQGINIVGTPASNLLTVSGIDASTTQIGVSEFADGTETTTGTDGTRSVTPLGLASKLGTQTANGLAYGNGTTGAIQWLAEATDGQIPIGQTGGAPVLSTLTAGVGVNIVNAASSITISVDSEVQNTIQTTDATPTTLLTFDMGASAGSYLAEIRVAAHNTTDTASAAYFLIGAARTDGASGTEVASEVSNALEDAAMSTADCTFLVSGNNMVIQVIGIAGKTIEWSGELEYRFAEQ